MRPWKNCEVDDAIYLKSGSESVHIFFTFTFALEIEIKGKEESGSFEKGHDKEQFELVVKRVAYEDRLAALLDDDGGQSSQDRWKKPAPQAKWKEVSHTVGLLALCEKSHTSKSFLESGAYTAITKTAP